MSTISASTTSTTAYKVTADTTGTLVFQTGATPTTAMTLGSDQSVTFAGTPTYSGGTANGVAYLNGSKVFTTGTSLVFDGTSLGVGVASPDSGVHLRVFGNAYYTAQYGSGNKGRYGADATGAFIESVGANPIVFYTNSLARARIDSNGFFYVGGTSGGKIANFIGSATDITYTNTDGPYSWNAGPIGSPFAGRFNWYYATSAVDRMYLTTAGALYNSTGTYGTISDVSLKENIVDATPKLDDVMRLRVRNYNMIDDPEKRKVIGVVAQELEEVFPGLVEETVNRVALEDGTFEANTVKAVKYSILTTILIKAIQELNDKVDAQTAEIATLKGAA